MKKNPILFCALQILLTSCIFGPTSLSYKKEINHIQDHYLSDHTKRNEVIKNQAFDDLRGCTFLIDMDQWIFSTRWSKGSWIRHQSWMYYNSTMVSETDAGIKDENFTYPKDSVLIYVGPWKDIHLGYGWPWSKTRFDKKIRFTAFQKKNDVRKGYIYGSYEFMTPHNQNIPEQPITLAKDFPTPEFETFCKVKWVAKYGYNAIFDERSVKIIEVKE